jgi:hypothetical protein
MELQSWRFYQHECFRIQDLFEAKSRLKCEASLNEEDDSQRKRNDESLNESTNLCFLFLFVMGCQISAVQNPERRVELRALYDLPMGLMFCTIFAVTVPTSFLFWVHIRVYRNL